MCDFSLHHVKSRPAKVGDSLMTCNFNTGTRGFAAPEGFHNGGVHSSRNRTCFFRGGEMRACSLGLLVLEDKNGKLQDGDLSADQQRPAACASRRTRVSGWNLCSLDALTRRAGGNGAATSGTAKNARREAAHRRVTYIG